jgi:DNA-binding beta-propeller fold protein YncE
MKLTKNLLTCLKAAPARLLLMAAMSLSPTTVRAGNDTLYIGDGGTDTVVRFDATTGKSLGGGSPLGVYKTANSGGLFGPRGLLIDSGKLLVANQNVDQPKNGEVLRYRLKDGLFDKALVPAADADSPYAPRGMINWRGMVYVADFTGNSNGGNDLDLPGRLLAFDEGKGTFRGEFVPPAGFAHSFHPRGLVIGPNGLLYVSSVPAFPLGGEVLVFDPKTLDFIGAFITDAGGAGQLNRPEGLVFGPDGNLYITSFRNDAADTDSIRVYDGGTGVFTGKIDLSAAGAPRAFAQALLFGPGGKLFVPVTGNDPTTTGQVRRYDVTTKQFDTFVAAGTSLASPYYLTFENTSAGTLTYCERGKGDRD